ncbi:hypothetical protein ACFE04_026801 [Oxalis oulophora]
MYMDAQIEMSSSEGYKRRKQYTKTNWMKLVKFVREKLGDIRWKIQEQEMTRFDMVNATDRQLSVVNYSFPTYFRTNFSPPLGKCVRTVEPPRGGSKFVDIGLKSCLTVSRLR